MTTLTPKLYALAGFVVALIIDPVAATEAALNLIATYNYTGSNKS
jgi:hypothetical protein